MFRSLFVKASITGSFWRNKAMVVWCFGLSKSLHMFYEVASLFSLHPGASLLLFSARYGPI
jgi:hypothetical protein